MHSTSDSADIFTAQDVIHLVFTEKSKFSFYFIFEYKEYNLTFSTVVFCSI